MLTLSTHIVYNSWNKPSYRPFWHIVSHSWYRLTLSHFWHRTEDIDHFDTPSLSHFWYITEQNTFLTNIVSLLFLLSVISFWFCVLFVLFYLFGPSFCALPVLYIIHVDLEKLPLYIGDTYRRGTCCASNI